jgi:hypothetical protein
MPLRKALLLGRMCILAAGVLTVVYSTIGFLLFIGVGLSGRFVSDLVAVGPILAFPVFLLGLVSTRAAAFGLWIYFIFEWSRCSIIGWPTLCLNPFDSASGKLLFIAVLLVQTSLALFSSALHGLPRKNIRDVFASPSIQVDRSPSD